MNSVVRQMFVVLMVVGGIAGLVLAGTEKLTKPLIEQHKREELRQSIFEVLPKAKSYEELETDALRVFKGFNEQHELVGYAFIAEGSGFQGKIRMIVGIEPDLDPLLGMRVLEQVETPGLGAKIAEETPKQDFFEQFAGLEPEWGEELQIPAAKESQTAEPETFITYVKNAQPDDPNEVQAITGATISSAAVVQIINRSLDTLEDLVEQKR
ncbi:RnfABCDGE type electron transport complex subunit G [candidate division KSB3 bacterium]|uniref:Ion-translocating oxidoreductase complex subunit G n=1 Tax=candidate division KSB3 bacterium TaxID=2044937 RepID=A0A9D5JUM5_9BACT|nr:RnfABCDGE type electron transport complex subunit G [candidate division KSB3 bacterium]MBD3323981.1 RnfABCDGE type electron transport complex subunit G [candidate division KSB3 bacterium]